MRSERSRRTARHHEPLAELVARARRVTTAATVKPSGAGRVQAGASACACLAGAAFVHGAVPRDAPAPHRTQPRRPTPATRWRGWRTTDSAARVRLCDLSARKRRWTQPIPIRPTCTPPQPEHAHVPRTSRIVQPRAAAAPGRRASRRCASAGESVSRALISAPPRGPTSFALDHDEAAGRPATGPRGSARKRCAARRCRAAATCSHPGSRARPSACRSRCTCRAST